MFIPFLYELRARRVPVGTQEAITLAGALAHGLHDSSLVGFYNVARATLIHSEAHLDAFDEAFLKVFQGVEVEAVKLKDELFDWLEQARARRHQLSEEELAMLKQFDLEELKRLFEERMNEQTERHDGGCLSAGTDEVQRSQRTN